MMLVQWSLLQGGPISPYRAPELSNSLHLHGFVYGSQVFQNGAEITTSRIEKILCVGPQLIVRTRSGSEYILGEVDPVYEARYPEARKRLLATTANEAQE